MAKKFCNIGGQALIEGVMMRGVKTIAIAIRKPDGTIEVTTQPVKGISTTAFMKIPFLRGILGLVSSMIVGTKALTYSAEVYSEADGTYEQTPFEKWVTEKLGKHADNVLIAVSMAIAMGLAFFLFGALPTLLINLLKNVSTSQVLLTTAESVTKIGVFIAYILIISQMKDIKRVFQYHGAEHKAIHCIENNRDLTVDNVRSYTTLHPRCGTSFLVIVLAVTIVVFSFISWSNVWVRIGLKILFMPLIAGIAYEIIKWAGRGDSLLVKLVSWPGLMMQKLTTKEPDDSQIEVAIAALQKVIELEGVSGKC